MCTEPTAHSFLSLSRPINFFHIAAAIPSIPCNRHLAVFSTGFIGSFVLSSLYASILEGGHKAHNADNTFLPVQWLEYPADYVSPTMDLFADDKAPLGVSPSQFCPRDSEHLERAFDLLRYEHLSMELGVPSVVNQGTTLAVLLRILGNTSSDSSAGFLSLSARDGSSTQGGDTNGDHSRWTGIATAFIVVAIITVFGLFEKHRRSTLPPASPSELSSNLENADFDGNRDLSLGDSCALVSRNQEPSCRVVIGILIDPKRNLELLLDDDPLVSSYTPYVVLKFYDYPNARLNVGRPEDGSAPDSFAARFDALQDALPSLEELRDMTEPLLLALARFVRLWMAIILCFVLRVIGFFVTGHFGRRAIDQLVRELIYGKPITNDDFQGLELQFIETPARPAIEPVSGSESSALTPETEVVANAITDDVTQIVDCGDVDISATTITQSDIDDPSIVDDDMQKESEEIVANEFTMLQPSPSSSSSVTLVDETVETNLAPVVDDEVEEDDGKGWKLVERRGRKGKGKAPAEDDAQAMVGTVAEPLVEPVSSTPSSRLDNRNFDALPFMPRLRGSRGHGRGRGPRPTVVAPA